MGTGKISSEETSVAKELALVVLGHRAKDIITLSLEIYSLSFALTSSFVKEKNTAILAIYHGSLIVTMGDYLLKSTHI